MKRMLTWAVPIALLACGGAAPHPAGAADAPGAKPQRQCFWPNAVNGFTAIDDRTVDVQVGANDVYRMELFAPCPDVDWAERLAFDHRGSTMICTGLDVTVIAPSTIGPQRCAVRNLRKLTPEEVTALSSRKKP
jgi:hypothetical protein